MSDTWTNRLSEYLDGELPESERATLEAHLRACADCRATLEQLRRVVARAQALDDTPPTTDLWPAIARHVGVVSLDARRARRRLSFTVPQLAAAAVALTLLSAGSAWRLLTRPAGAWPCQSPPTPAGLALAQQTDTTVPVRAGARLEVNNFGGEIAVKTWSKSAVRVTASHSSRDRITVDASEQVVRVKSESRRGPSQVVDYEITVPAAMALALSGVYTDITVDGSQGEITAETVQGTVKVSGGVGNVSLKSVQGDVTLEKARGRIDLSSVNETIKASQISGDVSAETVNGDISLVQIESANVEANTVNGDIEYAGTNQDGS